MADRVWFGMTRLGIVSYGRRGKVGCGEARYVRASFGLAGLESQFYNRR